MSSSDEQKNMYVVDLMKTHYEFSDIYIYILLSCSLNISLIIRGWGSCWVKLWRDPAISTT